MSTSAVFAAVAASQAAVAASEAAKAKSAMCSTVVSGYDAKTATTTQMLQYADCVQTLNPQPISSGAIILLKLLFIVALAGMAYGVWSTRYDSWSDRVIYAVLMFFFVPVVAMFFAAVIAGIVWLFI